MSFYFSLSFRMCSNLNLSKSYHTMWPRAITQLATRHCCDALGTLSKSLHANGTAVVYLFCLDRPCHTFWGSTRSLYSLFCRMLKESRINADPLCPIGIDLVRLSWLSRPSLLQDWQGPFHALCVWTVSVAWCLRIDMVGRPLLLDIKAADEQLFWSA